jgi:hypothetical protein
MKIDEYEDLIRSFGCLICGAPASLHHPRFAGAAGRKSSDWLQVPLCPKHHQSGGYGVAIHAGQSTWEKNYHPEPELVAMTIRMVAAKLQEGGRNEDIFNL